MVAFPDPATFQLVAWRPSDRPVARLFCDVKNPDGTPFAADSRYVLKRMLKKAADLGYTYYVGPELEFFLFANSTEPKILDHGGYFDAPPRDLANDVRRDLNFALESMGVAVEYRKAANKRHGERGRHGAAQRRRGPNDDARQGNAQFNERDVDLGHAKHKADDHHADKRQRHQP